MDSRSAARRSANCATRRVRDRHCHRCSVTWSWCFPDEQTPMLLNVLDRLRSGEQGLVPAFWSLEVLNTLLLGERKGRITPELTKAFFDPCES